MEKIYNDFLSLIYTLIFNKLAPCTMKQARGAISMIGDWLVIKRSIFIRIFITEKPPHLLSYFVLDKLVLQEMAYPLLNGLASFLKKKKKKLT